MSTKEEAKQLSLWQRFKKTALTIAVVVSLMWSFTNQIDIEEFKKIVGPIGTNPPQYTPSKFVTAELGMEHLHIPVNWLTDTIVGHNDGSNMLSKLGTVNDIRSGLATTASLSGYVPTGRTITINGTPFDLSTNRSWTITESDPVWSGVASSYRTKVQNDALYYAITNPNNFISRTGLSAGVGISYDNIMGIITNSAPYVAPTFNNTATKTLNGAGVQLSTTRNAMVTYSVTHSIALTALVMTGSSQLYLEISPNNSTWTTICQAGVSEAVVVGVSVNKSVTSNVQGNVPAGYYVRLRSVVAGGGSASFINGQETLF